MIYITFVDDFYPILFLYGRCLSPYSGSFDECSELNLWNWIPLSIHPGLYALKHFNNYLCYSFHIYCKGRITDNSQVALDAQFPKMDRLEEGLLQAVNVENRKCLARDRWKDSLYLKPCSTSPFSPALWKYNFDLGKLYSSGVISAHFGATCLNYRNVSVVDTNAATIRVGSCQKFGFRPLRFVFMLAPIFPSPQFTSPVPTTIPQNSSLQASKQEPILSPPEFVCPVTSLTLPLNLSTSLSEGHLFTGAGLYSKVF